MYEINDEVFDDNCVAEIALDYNLIIKSSLRVAYSEILDVLELYDKSRDKGSVNQHISETRIRAAIMNTYIYTEPFWEDISGIKDIFSYKFDKRRYPCANGADSIVTPKKINKFVRQTGKKYKYGGKESVILLDSSYIDESDSAATYKILEKYRYYELVRFDVINRIFALCISNKLYSIALLIYCSLCASRELCHIAFQANILDHIFNSYLYANEKYDSSSGVYINLRNPFEDKKYLAIIHYHMFYGFYLLYKEECMIKSSALLNNRHVIDLDAFCKIPNHVGSIDNHPFLPLTISSKYIHADLVGDEDYIIKPIRLNDTSAFNGRGLYSKLSFWKR